MLPLTFFIITLYCMEQKIKRPPPPCSCPWVLCCLPAEQVRPFGGGGEDPKHCGVGAACQTPSPPPPPSKRRAGWEFNWGRRGSSVRAYRRVCVCIYSVCMCAAMRSLPSPPAPAAAPPGGSARRGSTGRAAGPSVCSAPRCLLSHPPSGAGPGLAPGSRGREVLIFQWVFVRSESAPPAGLRAALPGLFITSLPGGSAAAPGLLPASRGGGGGVLRGGSRAATGPAGSPWAAVAGCAGGGGGRWGGTAGGGAARFQRVGAEMECEESAAESGSL